MLVTMKQDYPVLNPTFKSGGRYEVDAVLGAALVSAGSATEYVSPVPSLSQSGGVATTARTLVAAYEARRRENQILGNYLEPRSSLTAADTPTLSGSSTAPASDPTDPATQQISLFGSDLTGSSELSFDQAVLGKNWIRGYSPGAYNWGQAGCYRLSSTVNTYNNIGNQDKRPSDNYGYDAGVVYTDFILEGDVVYLRVLSGNKFGLWVNDCLIGATATLGTNVTFDAASLQFVPNIPGHGWTKIKFPSSSRRSVRVAFYGACSLGDLWTRSISSITPRCIAPVEWVHFGDSFSNYSGGSTSYYQCLTEYMSTSFGADINFVNVSQGGTSFFNPAQNHVGAVPVPGQKASFWQQYKLHWNKCTPKVVTALIGHNDASYTYTQLAPKVQEMFADICTANPGSIVMVATSNASPGIISNGTAASVETTIISAIAGIGKTQITTVPMQSAANKYGPLLRGTGRVGATNGTGNTDLWTHTDATHPSALGHKDTGLWLADRFAEVLRGYM